MSNLTAIVVGGIGLSIVGILGYQYLKKRSGSLDANDPFDVLSSLELTGQVVNESERPFIQGESFHIVNNRSKAIASVVPYIGQYAWIPVSVFDVTVDLDRLSRVKSHDSCATTLIYDVMQIIVFGKGNTLPDHKLQELYSAIAKAYLNYRQIPVHPGMTDSVLSVCGSI